LFPEWTWIIGFWIGAAVGSFLNVVIYRLPRGLSVAKPVHSFCPNCKARLTGPDLVPLLSWLFLGRKCRHCGKPVSSRYFIVELVNGCLWACVWWLHLSGPDTTGDPVRAVALMLFCSALVAAIFTDIAHYIIPDQINAFMLVVGLAANGIQIAQGAPGAWTGPLPSSVAGALAGVGALWGIALFGRLLFKKDAMGHGDIKMARGIGAVLFPMMALVSFGLAVMIGALVGGWVVYLRWTGKIKDPEVSEGEDDEPYEPESVGSLLWCGLGYVLCIDCLGLVWPKLYEWWFGENPYSVEEIEEEPQVELTMIPFGPSLAAGALAAVLFDGPLRQAVEGYLHTNFGGT
jgi:leader peptidase (prepilin peptidase)/N-methyltransferase